MAGDNVTTELVPVGAEKAPFSGQPSTDEVPVETTPSTGQSVLEKLAAKPLVEQLTEVEAIAAALPKTMKAERVRQPPVYPTTEQLTKSIEAAKAEFDAIVLRCHGMHEKYVDSDFPASTDPTAVVYRKKDAPNDGIPVPHEWKRLSEVCEKPELFVDGVSSSDVVEGILNTSYLLGAMSVVAGKRDHMEDLFVGYDAEAGVPCVRFFKDGQWLNVIIDDFVGIEEDGSFWGASCAEKNEVWVPLMEKAYARLHGSYETICNGLAACAMVDLTGGSGETRKVSEFGVEEAAFSYLEGILKKGALVSCGLWEEEEGVEEEEIDAMSGSVTDAPTSSLLVGRDYGVLRTVTTNDGHRLVQLRNPWSTGEFNGDWGDDSGEWTEDLQQELGYEVGDDGIFWMSSEEFFNTWSYITVCRVFEDPWVVCSVSGRFTKSDAYSKPYALQTVAEKGAVGRCVVTLSQRDRPLQRLDGDYKIPIGFSVYRCKRAGFNASARHFGAVYKKAEYAVAREVSLELDLDVRFVYVILVSSASQAEKPWAAGYTEPFNLRVYGSQALRLEDTGAPAFKPAFELGTKVARQIAVNTVKLQGLLTLFGELVAYDNSAPHYLIAFDGQDGSSDAIKKKTERVDAAALGEMAELHCFLEEVDQALKEMADS